MIVREVAEEDRNRLVEMAAEVKQFHETAEHATKMEGIAKRTLSDTETAVMDAMNTNSLLSTFTDDFRYVVTGR